MKIYSLVLALLVFLPACSQQGEARLTLVTPPGYSKPKSLQDTSWQTKADGALAIAETQAPEVVAPLPKTQKTQTILAKHAPRHRARAKHAAHRRHLGRGKLAGKAKVKWLAAQR